MLNLKFNCFGNPKYYKKILEYDNHLYKEARLNFKHEEELNIRLVDNVKKFENQIKNYKKSLIEFNDKERHKSKKKTKEQVIKKFNNTKIMRSYRLAINHIELDSIHNLNDSVEQKRQNIINFYKDCLNEVQKELSVNNKQNEIPLIVQADIHFDQTSPHLHFHISNIYSRHSKVLNKEAYFNNLNHTDLIKFLINEKIQNKLSNSVNDIFSNKIIKSNPEKKYKNINKVDLKNLFPEIYDPREYKNKIGQENKFGYWRVDKESFIKNSKRILNELGFEISKNDVLNMRQLDQLTLYFYKQHLLFKNELNKVKSNKQTIELTKNIRSDIQYNSLCKKIAIQNTIDKSINKKEIAKDIEFLNNANYEYVKKYSRSNECLLNNEKIINNPEILNLNLKHIDKDLSNIQETLENKLNLKNLIQNKKDIIYEQINNIKISEQIQLAQQTFEKLKNIQLNHNNDNSFDKKIFKTCSILKRELYLNIQENKFNEFKNKYDDLIDSLDNFKQNNNEQELNKKIMNTLDANDLRHKLVNSKDILKEQELNNDIEEKLSKPFKKEIATYDLDYHSTKKQINVNDVKEEIEYKKEIERRKY